MLVYEDTIEKYKTTKNKIILTWMVGKLEKMLAEKNYSTKISFFQTKPKPKQKKQNCSYLATRTGNNINTDMNVTNTTNGVTIIVLYIFIIYVNVEITARAEQNKYRSTTLN